jgi:hypothetical protein
MHVPAYAGMHFVRAYFVHDDAVALSSYVQTHIHRYIHACMHDDTVALSSYVHTYIHTHIRTYMHA